MELSKILQVYFGAITSIIKLFILYILTKSFGISGYLFLFLYIKIYQIIINKIFNLSPISFSDQIDILRETFNHFLVSSKTNSNHDRKYLNSSYLTIKSGENIPFQQLSYESDRGNPGDQPDQCRQGRFHQ